MASRDGSRSTKEFPQESRYHSAGALVIRGCIDFPSNASPWACVPGECPATARLRVEGAMLRMPSSVDGPRGDRQQAYAWQIAPPSCQPCMVASIRGPGGQHAAKSEGVVLVLGSRGRQQLAELAADGRRFLAQLHITTRTGKLLVDMSLLPHKTRA